MRVIIWMSKVLTAAMAVGLVLVSTVHAADLKVTIKHARNVQGLISIALYNSEQGFLKDGAAVRSLDLKLNGETVEADFTDLPPGVYAVAAFHDENASGSFDTNFLGVPEEGYGFSNGAKAFLGPPAFKDAAVPVSSESSEAKTEIELNY